MLTKIKKIIKVLKLECKQRGFYHFFIMYSSNFIAILRGLKFKIIYFKNIEASIFSVQSRTKFDIFNKGCKVIVGSFVFIRRSVTIRMDHGSHLYIGDKVFINDGCNINCIKKIIIGDYTKIGPNVSINDNDHNFRKIDGNRMCTGDVVIGKNVWIGANTIILKDSFIGDNAVIAAGSVVKGNVEANSVFFNKREKKCVQYV